MSAYLHQYSDFKMDTGIVTANSEWVVTTTSGSNPCLDAQLPALNSTHPWDQRLKVDSYGPVRTADGYKGEKFIVVVNYSSDGRFQFQPRVDKTVTGKKTLDDSFAKRVQSVPFLVKYPTHTPSQDASGNPTMLNSLDWKREDRKISVTMENVQIGVTLDTYSAEDRNYIAGQYGKLHKLANPSVSLFMFTGADIRQIADKKWHYTYSWLCDSGNWVPKVRTTALGNGGIEADIIGLYESDEIRVRQPDTAWGWRSPYWEFVVIPAVYDSVNPLLVLKAPLVRLVRTYADSDVTGYDGARNLPGNPV